MSRLWNKAYVLAHYPNAYASSSVRMGRRSWLVYWGEAFKVNQRAPRRAPSALRAWREAAEIIAHQKRSAA